MTPESQCCDLEATRQVAGKLSFRGKALCGFCLLCTILLCDRKLTVNGSRFSLG